MRALAFLLGLLCTAPGWAETWYVDQSGAGAGTTDGTSYANRFAGWTDACLNSGDIDTGDVVFGCGTATSAPAMCDNGASATSRLIISGACPNGAGGYDQGRIAVSGAVCMTSIQSRGYTTYTDLEFSGYTGTCMDIRSATGTWVLDSTFTGTNGGGDTALIIGPNSNIVRGVDINETTSGISTRGCVNCIFNDIDIVDGGAYGTGSTANTDGFGLDDSGGVGCEGTVVDGVRVIRQGSTQGSGIDFQCSAGTGTVYARNLYVTQSEGPGITVGSVSTLAYVFYGSISFDNAAADSSANAWYQKTTGTPASYYNVIGKQRSGATGSAFRFGDGSSTGMTATIKNSIFVADTQTVARTVASGTLTDSYNDYYGPLYDTVSGTRTLAQWIADGQCAGGGCVAVDPQFVGGTSPNSAAGFCLEFDSPLLAAGTYIGAWATGYNGEDLGKPPAIGARGLCRSRPFAGTRPAATRTP